MQPPNRIAAVFAIRIVLQDTYLGQALVTMEDEAFLWRRRIESGKSMFEVICNPNAPGEHVALFQEALQG